MNFRPIRNLGFSNFGRVLLAEDLGTGRRVAVKILDPSKIARPVGQLFAESVALAESESKFVVKVYAADFSPEQEPYLVMEYASRGSVRDFHGAGPIGVREAVQATIDGCHGLEVVHNRDLLHRDVKPENLLVHDEGHTMLSDFGLSCPQANPNDLNYSYSRHIPPEDVHGQQITSAAGDLYAMALTSYRLLNGDSMLDSALQSGDDVLTAIASGRYPDRKRWQPHVPSRVRRAIGKGLQMDPARRPGAVWEFRSELENALPVISFRPESGRTSWIGMSVDGAETWLVDVVASRSDFRLSTRRSREGGRPRRRRKDREYGSEDEAVVGAFELMTAIAESGDCPK